MAERESTAPQTPEGLLFSKAAGQYPASVTAQAAYISLESRRTSSDPLRMMNTLLLNRDEVKTLSNQAKSAHRYLIKPVDAGVNPTRNIIRYTFSFAHELSVLSNPEIQNILDRLYPQYYEGNLNNPDANLLLIEDKLRKEVDELVQSKKRRN